MTIRDGLIAVALAAALVSGCGGDADEQAGTTPTETPTATAEQPDSGGQADGGTVVDMTDDLVFDPKETTVEVGQTVQWRNVGTIGHTVTTEPEQVADPDRVSVPEGVDPWDSGLIREAEEFERTFDRPGTYSYVCVPHEGAGMVGTVVVEG